MSWQNLTNKELEDLSTQRLKEVYKRQRSWAKAASTHCGCKSNCYSRDEWKPDDEAEYVRRHIRLDFIKAILDKRDNVGDNPNYKTRDPALKNRRTKLKTQDDSAIPTKPTFGPITDLEKAVGMQVYKLSKKPFKSKLLYNTATGITRNPHTNRRAFTFEEDDSVVDAHICNIRNNK